MSTVLDALKKLQSERDRDGGGGPGALQGDVVDGGGPEPKRRRWALWLISLLTLLVAGAAAAYFFPETREELLASLKDPASSEETATEQGDAPGREIGPAAESPSGRAPALKRPDMAEGVDLEERMARQNAEIRARMEKNLKRRARARTKREATARTPAGSAPQALAANERPTSTTLAVHPAKEPSAAVTEPDVAPPKPVVQAARSAPVRPPGHSETPGQSKDWKAGEGSVRVAPSIPDPPSAKPEPTHAVAPAPPPEPTPPVEPKSASGEPPKPAPQSEPKPTELLGEPLATDLPFPEVSLEAVRWHPDAERREARLMVDNRRPVDVREGDIVAGVGVRRIDPGAVELTVGTSRMLIRIGE